MASTSIAPRLDPLPLPWYIFFAFVEPITTCAGAYVAIFTPQQFNHDLIPAAFRSISAGDTFKSEIKGVTGSDTTLQLLGDEGRVAISQLGSCYLLLAMLSSFLLPTVRSTLCDPKTKTPQTVLAAEKITRNMLLALAIADWIHILLTLQLLPPQPASSILDLTLLPSKVAYLMSHPHSWNQLLAGNVLATIVLFTFRGMWFMGVGRASQGAGIATGGKKRV